MSDVFYNVGSPEGCGVSQVKRFSVAAVPVIGFVHGAIERHRVDILELHSGYLEGNRQHDFLLRVFDYSRQGSSS
jgi:hypothetical protein